MRPRLVVVPDKGRASSGQTSGQTSGRAAGQAPAPRRRAPQSVVTPGRFPPLGAGGKIALGAAVLTGLVTHGWHLFEYPLYLTDEGIYMQRAWSLVRQTSLSPYTYDYDHAPGGWIQLAGWAFPLPNQFETFGNAINTGRVLMLLVHLAGIVLLFEIVRRLSGSLLAASVTAFFYNVSPIAVYYQRQVLLDNLMMFWVLLSLYLLLGRDMRIRHALGAGTALGMALITKENAIFFVPTLVYLLHRRVSGSTQRRFAKSLWPFATAVPVSGYVLYAVLKNELLPSGFDFDLNNPPADHVSLLYTLWWQLNRNQGSLLGQGSFLYNSWIPRDGLFLLLGLFSMLAALYWGFRDRQRNLGFLVIGTLTLAYTFYLVRGSVLLDFYIVPLIPLFAASIGMVTDRLLRRFRPAVRVALPALACAVLLIAPVTNYLLTINTEGRVAIADQYQPKLNLTRMQEQQVAWIRKHVPADARIIMDDDLWSELHDVAPFYPYAHSHWNASSDPDVRDKLFAKKWQNIDYIVMSNKMRQSMVGNNSDGRENWILTALKNSRQVWEAGQGDIKLQIYRVG
ncbi:glycosyltransferase family 39 protein [Streptomyces sp. NPDC020490]|uniref:glycosyltransferase family 39 protein n=1 Tax=Streptomyces sp. NPDC020490 TaxID=3365078 RepID=UPI0037954F8A